MAPTAIAVTPWMAGGEVMVEMEEKQRACAAEMQRVLEGSNVEGEESRDAAGAERACRWQEAQRSLRRR